MPKKSDPESFIEMFSNLGRDLKMPAVDVESIISHNRKNLEALEKSAKATASGASSLAAKQREIVQDALHEIIEAAQDFRNHANPQELMAKQAEFARRSFEAALKSTGEMAEIVRKSGTESVDVLRARIRESMEEIRDSFEKKK